jgi:small subunit ribosomal protein S4
MIIDAKCKICRRQGVKLFLRGERCFSPKCAMVKRPYAPGLKGKRRKRAPSEYAKGLREKQNLKKWYGLGERQFKRYVKEILEKTRKAGSGKDEDATLVLIRRLESRLDNVIFRLGIVSSRSFARQLVSHGYFKINNRAVDVPSFQVKKGDVIKIKPEKQKKKVFQNLVQALKKQRLPDWLVFDAQAFEAKVVNNPFLEPANLPAEISAIFEFYSR